LSFKVLLLTFILISCSKEESSSLVAGGDSINVSVKSLNIDSLAPINNLNKANYNITGTCEEKESALQVSFNNGELLESIFCNDFVFDATLDVSSVADNNDLSISFTEGNNTNLQSTTKDIVAPLITNNTFVNSTYKSSDIVSVTIFYDEAVFVTGTPSIELVMDNQASATTLLNYESGSGSNQLIFNYTIVPGDGDTDGVQLGGDISYSGGSINDLSGNPASTVLANLNFLSVLVDTSTPTITSMVEPVNGTYADGGGELLFQVNFSESVIVSGTPRLTLDIGGATRYANFISGSGTTGLEFKYVILDGDNDGDGIAFGNNLIDENGGTILSSSDNDPSGLNFSSFVDSMNGVLIDTSSIINQPDQVTGVTTAPTTSNTALSIAWSAPNDNGTSIINYAVQYREQGNTSWINLTPPSSTSMTVSGLSAGTTYEFRVAANNGLLGPYSAISNAKIFDILALNPIAWLSATNITNGGPEPVNGEKVAVWKDLTGSATDATEATESKQPTYEANVQNGLPAVKFDGTIDRGLEGSFTRSNNGGLTMFIVGKFSGASRRAFFEFYKTGGGTSPGSPRGFFFTYGFNNASTNYNLNNTEFNVWSAYDTGSNTDFWENGNLIYSNFGNWGNTSFTGSGSYVLGDDQTGGDRLNGYIGEILIFDREFTADEKATMETYLKNKWGTP
jgi:hypothetical protein